jgi:hypothetical protein
VNLKDILDAGILRAPLTVFRRYKGTDLKATIRSDGRVEFQGTSYDTPSSAADHARATITGRRMNTNGWDFWQYLDGDGRTVKLDSARKAFSQRSRKE